MISPGVHAMLDYGVQAGSGSMYNTPPTYAVYVAGLVFQWLLETGGLVAAEQRKVAKAASTVKAGQELTLRFGNRTLAVRIERVPEKNVSVQEAPSLYTVLGETRTEPPL